MPAANLAPQPSSVVRPGEARRNRPNVQYVEDYFVYSVSIDDLDVNETLQTNIQIQADADFKWVKAVYYASIANGVFDAGNRPIPNATVQMVDTGSGRQLFNQAVPIPAVFGTGELPFILPVPRIFKARSSINFTVANFDAAQNNYEIELVLIGSKIFEL